MSPEDHAEDLAKELANNHSHFESFGWASSAQPEDPENWAIVYTSSRDSGLIAESNEAVMMEELEPFMEADEPSILSQRHNHWAVGYVDGLVIRVYDSEGKITPAFMKYAELHAALEEYPLLSDSDHSEREYEAAIGAIEQRGPAVNKEGWAGEVFSWLWDNEQDELETVDDQGAWPSPASICRALEALEIPYECPGCYETVTVPGFAKLHRKVCGDVNKEWLEGED